MPLGEFELIARYFTRPTRRAVLGVGDDCALLAPSPGMQLAVSSDLLIEGRHFLSTVPPRALGHKALAVNLSDLAACGAEPLAFQLMLALPAADEAFLQAFSEGLLTLADAHGIELIGGDTTAGPLSVGITVLGEVPPGTALRRDGAQVGDDLWVSHSPGGGLGDARLALEVFRDHAELPGETFGRLRRAMEWPEPRVALGRALRGVAHAAIDLSDGLAGDLGHVLARSHVGALIEWGALPRSAALSAQPVPLQRQCVLGGGDDYELLFCAPVSARSAVRRAADQAAVAVSRIGQIESQDGLRVRWGDGTVAPWVARGFDHFTPDIP
ncbi:MAG TPA: thiamine-phosphate kinase [Burkholderiaceae bacterium]|nr:thiamine-phosphate kinase [Burkholderiaceae bacterium]